MEGAGASKGGGRVGMTDKIPLLRIENLEKHFGGVHAVADFNVQLRQGQIMGLIGPNGSGKTTVFNLITGIVPVDGGHIYFRDQEITRWKPHAITRAGIGRTFQNIRLFKGLSVIDNVKAALCRDASYTFGGALVGTRRARRVERQLTETAKGLLAQVELLEIARERPQNLPYGLQRKLEIARALAVCPELLLLDEPAAGLNPSEVEDMVSLIRRLPGEFNVCVFLIEHHMDLVMPICDDVYVLNMGTTIAHGTPQEIQNHHEVLRAYLGE